MRYQLNYIKKYVDMFYGQSKETEYFEEHEYDRAEKRAKTLSTKEQFLSEDGKPYIVTNIILCKERLDAKTEM